MSANISQTKPRSEPYDSVITIRSSIDVMINENYQTKNADLHAFYEKAKGQQWDVNKDLNWAHEHNPKNPLQMPDGTISIFGTPIWNKLGEENKADLRQQLQSWNISQILHGEQAALLCAAKIIQVESDVAAKLCAASQAIDEARHVEVFSKLLAEKFDSSYPISSSLRSLLSNVLSDSRPDFIYLGMQILIEGMALSLFQSMKAYTGDDFFKKLLSLVLRDEARHFAVGRVTLEELYKNFSAYEIREREEFVIEASLQLYEHFCADDVWQSAGLPKAECSRIARESAIADNLRRTLFRRLVPTIREMGLLGPKVCEVYTQLRVIDYANFPLAS